MAPAPRLSAGDPAPGFTLTADDGSTVSLADLRGSRVVLYVYPAAMTPGCTTQACDFRDDLSVFSRAGYRVLGLSPDKTSTLASFREKEGLTFPLLSDPSKEVLAAYGAYGEKQLYGKLVTGVIRSTFVLDEQGVVVLAQYAVKAKGHVAKLQRDLSLA